MQHILIMVARTAGPLSSLELIIAQQVSHLDVTSIARRHALLPPTNQRCSVEWLRTSCAVVLRDEAVTTEPLVLLTIL